MGSWCLHIYGPDSSGSSEWRTNDWGVGHHKVTIQHQPKRSGGGVLFNTGVAGWRVGGLAVQGPAGAGIRGLTGWVRGKVGVRCEREEAGLGEGFTGVAGLAIPAHQNGRPT